MVGLSLGICAVFFYFMNFPVVRGSLTKLVVLPILLLAPWSLILEEIRDVPATACSFRAALRGCSWREVREEIIVPIFIRAAPPFLGGKTGGGLMFIFGFFVLCEAVEDPSDRWQYLLSLQNLILHYALNVIASCSMARRAFEQIPIRRYRTRLIATAIRLVVFTWLMAVSLAEDSPLWRATEYYWGKWVAVWFLSQGNGEDTEFVAVILAYYVVGWQLAALLYSAHTLYGLKFETCTACGKSKRRETMMRCRVCKLVIYCDKTCMKADRANHPRPCTNHEGIIRPPAAPNSRSE